MSKKFYYTSDTAEAAFLLSNGIKLLSTDKQQFPAEFEFEDNNNGQLNDLLVKWETFDCSEHKFYKTYRYLLQQVKK